MAKLGYRWLNVGQVERTGVGLILSEGLSVRKVGQRRHFAATYIFSGLSICVDVTK